MNVSMLPRAIDDDRILFLVRPIGFLAHHKIAMTVVVCGNGQLLFTDNGILIVPVEIPPLAFRKPTDRGLLAGLRGSERR